MHASSESFNPAITSSSDAPTTDASESMTKPQIRICIEGNIGAGKTTLIESLSNIIIKHGRFDEVHVEFEQIDHKLLQLFNQNPIKWGLDFQNSMMNMRLEMLKRSRDHVERARNANRSCVVIIDTGPLREFAFTSANEIVGNITQTASQDHTNAFIRTINSDVNIMPEKIVLLNPLAGTCLKNIRNRNREHEANITLDYLSQVQKEHVVQIHTIQRYWPAVQLYTVAVNGEFADPIIVWNLIYTIERMKIPNKTALSLAC